MIDWIVSHQVISGWVFGLSVFCFIGGLVAMPILVARMRSDYFVSRHPSAESWSGRHPAIRLTLLVIKNGLGAVLVLAGLAMLVLPGQGVLTILVGISMLNFPGKRRLELRIVRKRPVLHAINWIRARANRPRLILPESGRDP